MAYAHRKSVPAKTVQRGVKTNRLTVVTQLEENGKVIEREVLAEGYEQVPNIVSEAPPDRIVLELSLDEAVTLAIMARQSGGNPTGRRGDMDSIGRELRAIGIDIDRAGVRYHPDLLSGIHFGQGRSNTYVSTGGLAPVTKDADPCYKGAGTGVASSSKVGGMSPVAGPSQDIRKMLQTEVAQRKAYDCARYSGPGSLYNW